MEECSSGGDAVDMEPISRDRCYTWPTAPVPAQLPQSASGDSTPSCSHDTQATPSSTIAFDTSALTCASQSNASKKPNPWGEASYADLITQALLRAPGGRLKLNEIYQWFSDNIEYFAQRSSPEAAAGWKNSIRHNLSLHSRFMRIQNEGAGKSSWWILNPDAKAGKATRRRAHTMETGSEGAKNTLERKRNRAKRKVEQLRLGEVDIKPDDATDPSAAFRARSNSTLSNYSAQTGSRISPSVNGTQLNHSSDSFESSQGLYWSNDGKGPGELVSLANNMSLKTHHEHNTLYVSNVSPAAAASGCRLVPSAPIKMEQATTPLPQMQPYQLQLTQLESRPPPPYAHIAAQTPPHAQTPSLRDVLMTPQQRVQLPHAQYTPYYTPPPEKHNAQQPSMPDDFEHINCDSFREMQLPDPCVLLRHELASGRGLDFNLPLS